MRLARVPDCIYDYLFLCRILVAALAMVGGITQAHAATISVSTPAELNKALASANPGDIIILSPGTYSGSFVISRKGSRAEPIRLNGPKTAILQNPDQGPGYAFYLDGAEYWVLDGFTVSNSKKGIMLDNASNNVLQNLEVHHIGAEGIHFRSFSTHNTLHGSFIHDTGTAEPGFGEGVYIGSAHSNWGKYSAGQPDKSDFNSVISNRIGPNVRAEGIDIKEGSSGGTIKNNLLDGSGISGQNYADSVIDVKGNGYQIIENKVVYKSTEGSAFLSDGFQVHQVIPNWGNNNTFISNTFDLNTNGYGINVQKRTSDNKVCKSNSVINTSGGVTNISVTTDC
jgi:parallel beta-helix repeat protein